MTKLCEAIELAVSVCMCIYPLHKFRYAIRLFSSLQWIFYPSLSVNVMTFLSRWVVQLKYASFVVLSHSLSLHPIYGMVSTLYLLITYTSAIGGKCARVDAFEDFISSMSVDVAVCVCVLGCLLFLLVSMRSMKPAHVLIKLSTFL